LVATVFWAKGSSNVVLEGRLQRGFEQSDFYPNGDCSSRHYSWRSLPTMVGGTNWVVIR